MAKIERKQGDTITVSETFERPGSRSSQALDLSDAQSVKIYVDHPSSGDLVVNDTAEITDAANGMVEYTLGGTQTARQGKHRLEFVAEFGGGETFSYPQTGFVSLKVTDSAARELPIEELADGDASVTGLAADAIRANTASAVDVMDALDLNNNPITSLPVPSNPADAARKDGLDTVASDLSSVESDLTSQVTRFDAHNNRHESGGADAIALGNLAGAISTGQLSDDAVTAAKIAAAAVQSGQIDTGAVGSNEIASDAVTAAEIASNAVGSSEIDTGAVGSAIDHGALNGTGDDDHLQYLHVDGRRSLTGPLDADDNDLENVGAVSETENVVADAGASYDIDLSNGGVHKITLTQDCDITLSGIDAAASNSATLIVEQDGTGGHSLTWSTYVLWPRGIPPSVTDGAGQIDRLAFTYIDGDWLGSEAGAGFA